MGRRQAAWILVLLAACQPLRPAASQSARAPTDLAPQPSATSSPSIPAASPGPTPAPSQPGGTGDLPEYVFHVAVNGDNGNPGTPSSPFATVEHARDVVRTLIPGMQGPIVVYLHEGTYPVTDTIDFGAQDSGQNGHEVSYRAAEGETPVLSGGISVSGWQQVLGSDLWIAVLGPVATFRQLYVNGARAQRASSQSPIVGIRWAGDDFSPRSGIVVPEASLPDFSRPQDLELHWINDWKDMRLLVSSIEANDDGTETIWMLQPYYSYAVGMDIENQRWIPRFDVPFYLENAPELIDSPGEWYYNRDTHELFYWPREAEDMRTAQVTIPQTQVLMRVAGNRVGEEVTNLAFEGLSFAYANWPRPSLMGSFGWQAQALLVTDQDLVMTPAHVQVASAHDVRFEGCRFEHLGAVGLSLGNSASEITVQGNLFHDISDGAVVVGHWDLAYIASPATQAVPRDNLVANNLIQDVGVEYWGAPAITAYYVEGLRIVHNEIANVPYSGISMGWGWTWSTDSTTARNNVIFGNLITGLMTRARDGGGIYTLGQQPNTTIEGNVIRNMTGDFACLYPDEGSAFITYRNNVCDSAPQWLHLWTTSIHDINIFDTYTNVDALEMRGISIDIENTVFVSEQSWPPEAQAIMDQAGLESSYSYLHAWLDAR